MPSRAPPWAVTRRAADDQPVMQAVRPAANRTPRAPDSLTLQGTAQPSCCPASRSGPGCHRRLPKPMHHPADRYPFPAPDDPFVTRALRIHASVTCCASTSSFLRVRDQPRPRLHSPTAPCTEALRQRVWRLGQLAARGAPFAARDERIALLVQRRIVLHPLRGHEAAQVLRWWIEQHRRGDVAGTLAGVAPHDVAAQRMPHQHQRPVQAGCKNSACRSDTSAPSPRGSGPASLKP